MRKTRLKPVSDKRQKQIVSERQLIQILLERSGGLCEICHRPPDFRGLSKHEKIHRAQGGDPLDPENTQLLCGFCHSKAHGIQEDKPSSIPRKIAPKPKWLGG